MSWFVVCGLWTGPTSDEYKDGGLFHLDAAASRTVFDGLDSIKCIQMRGHRLTTIPSLRSTPKLESLLLSGNRITEIASGTAVSNAQEQGMRGTS